MQIGTEDLLTLRDGEPIDAELKVRLLADADALGAIRDLARRRDALAALPEVVPDDGMRERVLAAMGAVPRRGARGYGRFATAAAGAAVVAVAAVLAVVALAPERSAQPGTVAAERNAPAVDAPSGRGPAAAPDDAALIEQSAQLERLLTRLPAQRTVMSVGTAGTIASLEDQIALIDAELTLTAARAIEPDYRTALWRERVDVMNALVQVRYAQSKMFAF